MLRSSQYSGDPHRITSCVNMMQNMEIFSFPEEKAFLDTFLKAELVIRNEIRPIFLCALMATGDVAGPSAGRITAMTWMSCNSRLRKPLSNKALGGAQNPTPISLKWMVKKSLSPQIRCFVVVVVLKVLQNVPLWQHS